MKSVREVLESEYGKRLLKDAVALNQAGEDAVLANVGWYSSVYEEGVLGLRPDVAMLAPSLSDLVERGREFLASHFEALRSVVCLSGSVRKMADSSLLALLPEVATVIADKMNLEGSLVGLSVALALALLRDGVYALCKDLWN
jgi:hypothetical protein